MEHAQRLARRAFTCSHLLPNMTQDAMIESETVPYLSSPQSVSTTDSARRPQSLSAPRTAPGARSGRWEHKHRLSEECLHHGVT